MLPAVPATCLPDKPQESHRQEELGGASGHSKEKHVLLAFICVNKRRGSHHAVSLRGSGGTRGHRQGGWRALHTAVPRMGAAKQQGASQKPHTSVTFASPAVGRRWLQVADRQLCSLCLLSSPSVTPPPRHLHSPPRHKHPWGNVGLCKPLPAHSPSHCHHHNPTTQGGTVAPKGPGQELSPQFPTPAAADKPLPKPAEEESLPLLIAHL